MAVWIFDVNETLLDLGALDEPVFGGDTALRRRWFAQMIQSALVTTVTGGYRPFGEIGAAALRMVAPDASPDALREGMASLPAHPDARPALEALHAHGDTLAALTQSQRPVLEAQLANAGLRELFHHALTADDVGRLKPAPDPYRHACVQLGVHPADATMVAAHAWDVAGAAAAGLQTVLVARPGVVPDPSQPAPGRIVDDLRALADG